MTQFDTLPGYYKFIFLYFEPISEVGPLIGSLMYGPSWFYNELTPSSEPPPTDLDPRAAIAIWQLSICYLLLFLIQSFGYRAVRDTLKNNLAGQERIMGVFLGSLAMADIVHLTLTFINLPQESKYSPSEWNTTTHGNLTVVFLLHVSRISWFLGVGRTRYYFGQSVRAQKTG
ncbi:hypothetical protein HYPSUDRAFT_32802 [Hypholoma sublateritium FD-334 SS-4]|uniref:DUF7704 domain-containing protein n=1 Tax=Hypholoma sublateritium (strain FD-334 SS-4) TaxID=945553 RepID=A0A0D2QCM5_HYPSF|nr:hypothetical protein HYPSUDRAFT_32802 [Hypholoma sublateritium FD-334 SS-4]